MEHPLHGWPIAVAMKPMVQALTFPLALDNRNETKNK